MKNQRIEHHHAFFPQYQSYRKKQDQLLRKRSCTTCKYAQIKGLKYICNAGKEIPEGKMFIGCESYAWDEKDHCQAAASSVFGNLFGGIL